MLRLDINLVFTIINLLILYVLVRMFLLKPIHRILEARKAELEKLYEDAKVERDAAGALKKQYEASVAGAEWERDELLKTARSKAVQESDRLLEDARERADKIVRDAERSADEWHHRRMQQAKDEISDLVLEAAAKISGFHQGIDADRELYDQFLAKTGEQSE